MRSSVSSARADSHAPTTSRSAASTSSCAAEVLGVELLAAQPLQVRHVGGVALRRVERQRLREPPDAARPAVDAAARRHREAGAPDQPAQRLRDPPEPRRRQVGDVARVAGEDLVAAVAVERDGDVPARHLGKREGRNRGRVGERLAVMAHDARQQLDRARLDHQLRVLGAEALGDDPRKRQLVEPLVREADRERPHGRRGRLRHRRDDCRRIDAAREEGAERHVGDHAPPHRGPQPRPQLLRQFPLVG